MQIVCLLSSFFFTPHPPPSLFFPFASLRLQMTRKEYELLFFSISGARIFFKQSDEYEDLKGKAKKVNHVLTYLQLVYFRCTVRLPEWNDKESFFLTHSLSSSNIAGKCSRSPPPSPRRIELTWCRMNFMTNYFSYTLYLSLHLAKSSTTAM